MGQPKHPRELLSHNCLRVGAGERIYDSWEFESKGKAFSVVVKGNLIMNDAMFATDAVQEGAGLFYTNQDGIADRLASGKLETVLDSYVATSDGYYLYFPERSQVQPKLRAFIDHVKEEKNSAK